MEYKRKRLIRAAFAKSRNQKKADGAAGGIGSRRRKNTPRRLFPKKPHTR